MTDAILAVSVALDFTLAIILRGTMLLLLGLLVSSVWRNRPDRAHRILSGAIIASLCFPFVYWIVDFNDWGLLPLPTEELARMDVEPWSNESAPWPSHTQSDVRAPYVDPPSMESARDNSPVSDAELTAGDSVSLVPALFEAEEPARFDAFASTDVVPTDDPFLTGQMLTVFVALWVIVSMALSARMLAHFLRGRVIVAEAHQAPPTWICLAAQNAARRFHLREPPNIRISEKAQSPMIWCWSKTAWVLIPRDIDQQQEIDWVAVLSHELAHWVRRDHWWMLSADILVALVPWNPVHWLCRHRLHQLSEMACDDWAVTQGGSRTDYAESLLHLLPQRRSTMALTVVGRSGVVGRIQRILDAKSLRATPIGKRWSIIVMSIVLLIVAATGLAQKSKHAEKSDTLPQNSGTEAGVDDKQVSSTPRPATTADASDRKNGSTTVTDDVGQHRTIRGRITLPDGSPASSALVFWMGPRTNTLPSNARPRGTRSRMIPVVLAQAVADRDGRFQFGAVGPRANDSIERSFSCLIARVDEYGWGGTRVTEQADYDIELPKELPIEGQLFTPDGEPASDVRVHLEDIMHIESMLPPSAWAVRSRIWRDGAVADFAPFGATSTRTDEAGRFRLRGFSKGSMATLKIESRDYAPEEIEIQSPAGFLGTLTSMLANSGALKPSFIHTLEPGRIVRGTVTAKDTGNPLVNATIEVIAMRRRGGRSLYTTTDGNGSYEVTCGTGDRYHLRVYPPAGVPYLADNHTETEWADGSQPLQKDFQLSSGRLVKGQVVDQDTGRPVSGASVAYRPKNGNQFAPSEDQFRSSILTDAQGKFVATVVPGPGFLVVEAPGDYVRHRLSVKQHGSRYGEDWFLHGYQSIDIPETGRNQPVAIQLSKGVTLKAAVTTPEGDPVPNISAFYLGMGAQLTHRFDNGTHFPTHEVELTACDPNRTYRVYFYQSQLRMGAVVDMKYDAEDSVIPVVLKKNGTIRGRLVRSDGTPGAKAQVFPSIVINNDKTPTRGRTRQRNDTMIHAALSGELGLANALDLRTDDDGKFELDNLIAGAKIVITGYTMGERPNERPTFVLNPGETRDIGDIVMERSQ